MRGWLPNFARIGDDGAGENGFRQRVGRGQYSIHSTPPGHARERGEKKVAEPPRSATIEAVAIRWCATSDTVSVAERFISSTNPLAQGDPSALVSVPFFLAGVI
jgi:hypothetical protein